MFRYREQQKSPLVASDATSLPSPRFDFRGSDGIDYQPNQFALTSAANTVPGVHGVPPDADSDFFSFSEFDNIRLRISTGLSSLVNFTNPQKRGYANNIDDTIDSDLPSTCKQTESSRIEDGSVKNDVALSFDNPTFQA